MSEVTTTATTNEANIVSQPGLQYVTEAPRGQVFIVEPHAPSR